MRRLSVIVLLPFFLYACGSSSDDVDVREERIESRDFSSSQINKLRIDTENGSIQNSVRTDGLINVVLEKWATGSNSAEADRNIDDIEVSITEDTASGLLNIEVDVPDNTETDYGCSISVDIPAAMELDLESLNGGITIADTTGKAKLKTLNGKITVRNHSGNLDGETSNGEIDVDIMLPDEGECKLKTSNGSITLSIPDTTSAEIEASTLNGKIEIDHPGVMAEKVEDKEFKGEIGDGDGDIELETLNGNIVIKQL
ncbi:DUF4097 domain-containing protein [Candidatus Poribacteria bacterium]